jgi:hypothetical protein
MKKAIKLAPRLKEKYVAQIQQSKILLNLCLFEAFFTTFSLFYLILTDSNKLTN